MAEEKKQPQQKDSSKSSRKKPETEMGKDATAERVEEEENGGALPSNHSDESQDRE